MFEYIYWQNYKEKHQLLPTLEAAMKLAHHHWITGDADPKYVWERSPMIKHGLRKMFEYWKSKGWKY